MKTARQLSADISTALVAAGERECGIRVTRTTGRVRYEPAADGFRLRVSFDNIEGMTKKIGECWVGVTCHGNKKNILARYADELRAAGFDVVIASTCIYKSVKAVYVTTPASFREVEDQESSS